MKIFETFEEVKNMKPCRKKPVIVSCKQIFEPFNVRTLEGNYKIGKVGDYLIKGIDGELYIHDREIFEKVYDLLEEPIKNRCYSDQSKECTCNGEGGCENAYF